MTHARTTRTIRLVDKTAIKTGTPSPRSGYALPVGAHPGNTGGKKGRSGRPPQAFKDFLAMLRDDPKAQQALEKAARAAGSKNFAAVWKVAVAYDETKPAQRVQIDVARISSMTDDELKAIVAGKK